jgi:uracil-DNA glycosylase family 4
MALITTGTKHVPPRGPDNAKIMVVGEAPGAHEERVGQPFVGPAGNLLDEMLAASGIDPATTFYTNICPYRPPNNDLRAFFNDAGEPNAQVQQGLAELIGQVNRIQPNVIVPLGNYPMAMLTGVARWSKKNGYTGIGDYRGSILQGNALTGGRKCIPTYHPANVLREYSNKPIVKMDLRRAFSELGFPEIRRPIKRVVCDPRGSDRAAWLQWLRSPAGTPSIPVEFKLPNGSTEWRTLPSQPFGSGDIEYISSKLLCLGATRHRDIAIVFATLNDSDIREIRDLLECGVPWCFQNGMFDCSILEWFYGVRVTQHLRHDTMLMMHVAYTEYPKDLGFIGSVFTDQPNWKWMVDWKKIASGEQPISDVYEYNGIDTWVTQEAAEKMLEDELQPKFNSLTYDFEAALIAPLWEMSARGVKIDTETLGTLRAKLETEVNAMNWGLEQVNGGTPVNVKSGPQLVKLLYDKLDVPRGKKTATQAWSFDDGTLADLLIKAKTDQQRAVIKTIRGIRERRDLISKFCDIELDDDGRMRCHYDPAKTQTGRLSSRKFYPTNRGGNLQNIPRDTRVRMVFVPDDGCVFGYADLKSAESLVVANITGDPEMLRLHSSEFMTGEADGHRYVASYLFDKPMDKINKEERYIGKKVRHGCNYGMSWFRLMQVINAEAQETGVSINAATAKILINKYRQLHPYLEAWWRDVQAQLWKTRTIYTTKKWIECNLLPHHRWTPEEEAAGGAWHQRPHIFFGRPDAILPEAIAQNPQGTIADTLNIGLLRAARDRTLAEMGYRGLLQVHDAIGFQAPSDRILQVASRLSELMSVQLRVERKGQEPVTFTVPVDVKIGMNWGEYDPKKPEQNPNGLVDIKDWMKRQAA